MVDLCLDRLDAGLRLIDAITVEVGWADAELRTAFAGDDRTRRLLPIPGIGLVTAATVVAEVWDIDRFPSPERLCSWAGLTPGERTSDAHSRRGHITTQDSRWLRWMLVEAATTAVRDPQLGRFADQTAQRRGPKIARVALARRLFTLCYYALRDKDGCRAYPCQSPVAGGMVNRPGFTGGSGMPRHAPCCVESGSWIASCHGGGPGLRGLGWR
jgi:transposase